MSDWTLKDVADRADKAFRYYQEEKPEDAVLEAVNSILADLGKFEDGRIVLRGLNVPALLDLAADSDDTSMWTLIKELRRAKVVRRKP